jgi:hypothetical protein
VKRAWVLAVATALPLTALAQAYKWKDENGQIHFSQLPPKGIESEMVGGAPPPLSNPNQEELDKALTDAQKAAPDREKAAADLAAQQAKRQETCRASIERLAYLDAHTPRRLATTDESGKAARMSDEEFTRQRAAEQDKINQNCS